jgi:hypothetical protein
MNGSRQKRVAVLENHRPLRRGRAQLVVATNYYSLTMKLGNYQDKLVPPVVTGLTSAASQFSVSVPRGTNLALRLNPDGTLDPGGSV